MGSSVNLAAFAALPAGLAAVIGVLLGLLAGSYIATMLVRWPQGLSANRGRSRCDGCGRQLSWYELVPIAGFLLAKGQCRSCGARIDPLHLYVELVCGALGSVLFALEWPLLAPLVWLLVALALFDLLYLWLPDRLTLPLAAVAFISPPWIEGLSLGERLVGGIIGFGALWLVGTGFRRMTGREGLGGGDPKLLGAIGLWLGPLSLPLLLLTACLIGLTDAAVRLLRGAERATLKLPLGLYLAIAAIGFAVARPFITT